MIALARFTSRVHESRRIMLGFAERTGLSTSRPPARHLATDAWAVDNLVRLACLRHGDEEFVRLALRLIDQTHDVLGRHRAEEGGAWLSGLPEAEARRHPTAGGLRLGNHLPERRPDEPFDHGDELSSDGQSFHDLARWMRALDHVARLTGDVSFNRWARELARTACHAFHAASTRGRPLLRKMSSDLTYPLVGDASRFGPLDGLLTYLELEATAAALGAGDDPPDLRLEVDELAELAVGLRLRTRDPLAGAGLLAGAVAQLELMTACGAGDARFPLLLVAAASEGLVHVASNLGVHLGAEARSPLEELSLSRAIRQATQLRGDPRLEPVAGPLADLASMVGLAQTVELFWSHPRERRSETWRRHLELHEVSLAASLLADARIGRPQL